MTPPTKPGRPTKPDVPTRAVFTFRPTPALHERMKAESDRAGISINAILSLATEAWLEAGERQRRAGKP